MPIEPKLTITRFAQLAAGDLFIFEHPHGSCVALVASDPTQNGEKLVLSLGPSLPAGAIGPTLYGGVRATTVSFGKEFILRLPSRASGWCEREPPPETPSILVMGGAAYVRANRVPNPQFQPCYVNVETGVIFTRGQGLVEEFVRPPGSALFAVEWQLVTTESEARMILAYPPS
jgi:hypothetical protein